MKSFFGIGFDNLVNYNDNFNVIYDDCDEIIIESKEKFTHEEDDYSFNYHYAIQAVVMDNGVNYELHLVFDYDSLSDKHKQELLDFCGVEEGETNSMDSIQCGFSILMASEYIKDATDIDEEIVNKIASVYFFIDRLRGFYFDKPINRIGTKGWDWINHIINGKKIKFFG